MTSIEAHLSQPAKLRLAATLKRIAWVISILVLGLVGLMRRIKFELPEGMSLSFLPQVHAILNSIVVVLLIVALVAIKRRNVDIHKKAIGAAMICSIAFLCCYVAYHITSQETTFGGQGFVRIVYYFLLITHIISAAVSFPFILFTWIYGFTNQFQRHREFAKWVFPVWLYVAVTGPVCYLMLRPYY